MEFTEDLFKKNLLKISYNDLLSLNELLKTGLPIKRCLALIETKYNQKTFQEIQTKLNKGMLIEEIIGDYLPKEVKTYCLPLLKTMDFSSALNLSLSFYTKAKENLKALQKAILYPFVLLFVSLTALYLFDSYGLDSILDLLKSFSSDLKSFTVVRTIFKVIVYFFYFGMLILLISLAYFIRNRNIALFYVLISKYFKDSIVHIYFCEEFVSLFLICLDLGYKTKDALDILKSLHNKPITSLLAFHLDERLLKGDSLKEASEQSYFDSSLAKFINVAIHTNDFGRILLDYVKLSRNKIENSMKKLASAVQICSYVVVGGIVIFIYQVLFLPMQAISKF